MNRAKLRTAILLSVLLTPVAFTQSWAEPEAQPSAEEPAAGETPATEAAEPPETTGSSGSAAAITEAGETDLGETDSGEGESVATDVGTPAEPEPDDAEAALQAGIDAYRAGDYVAARHAWKPLAEAGHVDALFNLGQLYRSGKGVDRDLERAEYYYRRAAEAGSVAAQGNLGTLHYFAFPDSPHVKEALSWWRRAAVAGDARAQYMLGVLRFNGSHVERDFARAYGWTLLAARSGLEEAIAAEKTMLEHLSLDELERGKLLSETLMTEDPALDVVEAPEIEETPEMGEAGTLADGGESAAPASAPASTPASTSESNRGRFFVQLMAMRDLREIERVAAQFRERYTELLGEDSLRVRPPDSADGSGFYALQLGPFGGLAAADQRCADFRERGQDCFVWMNRE